MDITTAIRVRQSTRRYARQAVERRVLARLVESARQGDHLCEPGASVVLLNGRERVARVLARYRGLYGLVEGAPHLLVGIIPQDTDRHRLDLGYVLEPLVLEATRLGLATCWITGSYHPDQAVREVEVGPGEVAAAVVALGYPRRDLLARFHDGAVRRLAGGHRRRPLEEIVFAGRWGGAWRPDGADPALVEVLECARLAPSAVNRQPWRFIITGDAIHLALVHPAPIDAGIVMAHVALAAQSVGIEGCWTVRWRDPALGDSLGLPSAVVPVGSFSAALPQSPPESA